MASILDKIQTISDYQHANDEFQARKAAAAQAAQLGQLDALNKKNVYATQVLSGAAATGNQSAYDAARKHLADNGIDLSPWAPDVATGAQQAQAARLAQSPLGSLINAGLKQDSNNIALGGLTGQVPTLNGVANLVGGQIPGVNTQNPQPAPQGMIPGAPQAQPLPQSQPSASGVNTPQPAPSPAGGAFTPPAQLPNETRQSYNDRVNQAFAQYKETPEAIRGKAAAENQGKTDVGNIEAANKAQELTDRLTQNLTAMAKLNDNVPQSGFLPASAHAYMSRALGANQWIPGTDSTSGDASKAYEQWNQIDNQQVLTEIQQFIASGGANARVNQTLEKIAKAASSISPESSPETRAAMIRNALAELSNKNIGVQNLVKNNQGKPTDSYVPIPVTTPDGTAQPAPVNLPGASDQVPTKAEKAVSILDTLPKVNANNINMQAALALKKNPALADQFDAKYGVGASRLVLGK